VLSVGVSSMKALPTSPLDTGRRRERIVPFYALRAVTYPKTLGASTQPDDEG
jgi:hypothetical protein